MRRLKTTCDAVGRDFSSVELLAVSKFQPIEKITALNRLGQKTFAENYQQELTHKAQTLKALGLRWVFIGRLQSNKIAKIVAASDEIQSLSNPKHAGLIAKYAQELGKTPFPVYIGVNAGEESSKGGVSLFGQDREHLQKTILSLPQLKLMGIMAIPPSTLFANVAPFEPPPLYQHLANLARQCGAGRLSLGMSDDLEAAIGAGSDCIRIGTAIFGARPNPHG
jgi:pyridoxal phosphate enzyme (YggS family)